MTPKPICSTIVDEMGKSDYLSEIQQWILSALMMLGPGENAYGMTVHAKVEELAEGRAVSLGTCYTTLDRLEQAGYVKSWFGGATEERGGRSKRFFEITGAGEKALMKSLRVADNMVKGLREIGGVV